MSGIALDTFWAPLVLATRADGPAPSLRRCATEAATSQLTSCLCKTLSSSQHLFRTSGIETMVPECSEPVVGCATWGLGCQQLHASEVVVVSILVQIRLWVRSVWVSQLNDFVDLGQGAKCCYTYLSGCVQNFTYR